MSGAAQKSSVFWKVSTRCHASERNTRRATNLLFGRALPVSAAGGQDPRSSEAAMSEKPEGTAGGSAYAAEDGGDNPEQESSGSYATTEAEQVPGLKPALREARHRLEESAERGAERLTESALNTGEQLGQALSAAAKSLRDKESWLAGPAQELAQSVQRLTARGLGSPAEMKARLGDFARLHPAWALAGAVVLGFGAARLLKSGGEAEPAAAHEPSSEEQQSGRSETPDAVPGTQSGGYAHG
jgi:hypothetical protein